ncbi:MAG: TIGR03089 family protein [Corynebacterium sp.]|nr:TIGR03089 family protein [Corynebacterium sp.]
MDILRDLLAADPSRPRLTFYDETLGVRIEFSATTLANWANKTAGWLVEECEFTELYEHAYPTANEEPNGHISLAAGVNWQTVGLALGALTVGARFTVGADFHSDYILCTYKDMDQLYIATLEAHGAMSDDDTFDFQEYPSLAVITEDPFGRGVREVGLELPDYAIDYGPEVRVNDDAYHNACPSLIDALSNLTGSRIEKAEHHKRMLCRGWNDTDSLVENILIPLAQGHTVVVVHGPATEERLAKIAEEERISAD